MSNSTPVRAEIANNIAASRYTSVKLRNQQLRKNPERANQPLMPLVGARSFTTLQGDTQGDDTQGHPPLR